MTMSFPITLKAFAKLTQQAHLHIIPTKPEQFDNFPLLKLRVLPSMARPSAHKNSGQLPLVSPVEPRWQNVLSTAASLYPLYVTVGGVVACLKPSAFAWFVKSRPASYSLSLGFIMLAMGLTLDFKDLLALLTQRPRSIIKDASLRNMFYRDFGAYFDTLRQSHKAGTFFVGSVLWTNYIMEILFGCVAQYTIMPAIGVIVSKSLGLPPSLSVGLILLSCCPGGTASNVVTLIAQGDVPLSVVMTVCTTLGGVLLTPLLTKFLVGTYVPVDAAKLSISTLQVVVAPILLGSYIQSTFSAALKIVTPFAPLFAVLVSSLLACSVFSENVVHVRSSMLGALLPSDPSPIFRVQSLLSGELGATLLSVLLLHFTGFFVGYLSAAICGFRERQRRAVSIEVGMQNSSLGVVLATSHFTSPMVALPAAMSAVIMNIMGSSLGFFWRYIDPSDPKNIPNKVDVNGKH